MAHEWHVHGSMHQLPDCEQVAASSQLQPTTNRTCTPHPQGVQTETRVHRCIITPVSTVKSQTSCMVPHPTNQQHQGHAQPLKATHFSGSGNRNKHCAKHTCHIGHSTSCACRESGQCKAATVIVTEIARQCKQCMADSTNCCAIAIELKRAQHSLVVLHCCID